MSELVAEKPVDWKEVNTKAVIGAIIDNISWRHEGEWTRLHLVLDNLDKDSQQLFAEIAQQSPAAGGADPILVEVLNQLAELRAELAAAKGETSAPAIVEIPPVAVVETPAEKVARLQAELAMAETEAGSTSSLAGP